MQLHTYVSLASSECNLMWM